MKILVKPKWTQGELLFESVALCACELLILLHPNRYPKKGLKKRIVEAQSDPGISVFEFTC